MYLNLLFIRQWSVYKQVEDKIITIAMRFYSEQPRKIPYCHMPMDIAMMALGKKTNKQTNSDEPFPTKIQNHKLGWLNKCTVICMKSCPPKPLLRFIGRFPFNQNFQFEFSTTSSSEWNSIFQNL